MFLPNKVETKQRKKAMAGLREISGAEKARQSLYQVISTGKRALDELMLDMGRMLAESIMLAEE